jgi:hypothetical protein
LKALFEYIAARITARVTDIRTVRMWNSQLEHQNTSLSKDKGTYKSTGFKDEQAFRYPAVFIEFIVESVNNLPMQVKDYILTVRFRFARESYKFTRLETFDFVDAFDQAIQMMAPTDASGLTFTTFQEVLTEWDENHDNVEAPYRDYRTRYRYQLTQNTIDVTGTSLEVNADIVV